MSRSKKKKKKRSGGRKKAPREPGRGRAIAGYALLVAVVLGLAVGGTWYAFDRMSDYIYNHPAYQVDRDSLTLTSVPDWMTPSMRAELDIRTLAPSLPERFSLLDKAVCDALRRAYEASPWVERVNYVVKRDPLVTPDRKLEVSLTFRRPLAFVSGPNGFYLVDRHGVRLPGVYREPVLTDCGPERRDMRLLVVTGVTSRGGPPPPGKVWAAEGLAAGLKVAAGLDPKKKSLGVRLVDVSNVGYRRSDRQSEILVYTAGRNGPRTEIRWGKAPGSYASRLQEKTVAEKVAYLEMLARRHGSLDTGALEYIRVQDEVVRPRADRDEIQYSRS